MESELTEVSKLFALYLIKEICDRRSITLMIINSPSRDKDELFSHSNTYAQKAATHERASQLIHFQLLILNYASKIKFYIKVSLITSDFLFNTVEPNSL